MSSFSGFVVEYYTSSAWVSIPNLVSLNCTIGRKQITDSFAASNSTFVFRYPTGFVSPLADLNIDIPIRFRTPNNLTGEPSWSGFIKDASVEWGKPFNAGVGQADYLTIVAEDAFALWGRVIGDGLALGAGTASGTISVATANYGLAWNGNVTSEPVGASTVTGSFMDWTQKIINTIQGRPLNGWNQPTALDAAQPPTAYLARNAEIQDATVQFSDTTNDATNRIYDQLTFDSLSDNYYDQVLVKSPGLADQTAETGSAPYRTFTVETFSNSTSQMDDIANYVLTIAQGQVIAPSSVSAVTSGQHTQNLDTLGGTRFITTILKMVKIVFRGTTYYSRVEGATMSADPEQTRVTYYLSPQQANLWFVLDSAVSGVLNQNRLGLY
jgi:hypothetical protein